MGEEINTVRLKIILIFILCIVVVLIFRYSSIMLFNSDPSTMPEINMPQVERGPILDRNGNILAIQTRLNTVSAWTPHIENLEETSRLLEEVLEIPKEDITNKIEQSDGFIFIKRKITPTASRKIQDLLDSGKLKGISLMPEYGRNYPEKHVASHVLGYVGVDNIGLEGIEYTLNNVLSPPVVGGDADIVYGNQVFLTIDLAVQYSLQEIARKTYEKNKADAVMLLAMDASNADILAYVSIPDYDPNKFGTSASGDLRNRPISLLYEPGSVYKIFTISSILQSGGITKNDLFTTQGFYENVLNDGTVYRITDLANYGTINAEQIIKFSSNVGAAFASENISRKELHYMLTQFGFGNLTGLPLNGEQSGLVRKPEEWSPRSKQTIAFGQEVSVSAIQMITGATVFANDGVLLEPHIVKKIVSPEGKVIKAFNRTPIREVLSPAVAQEMLLMMESATADNGTARRAKVENLRVSAKTGTAEMLDPETGKYSEDSFVASCLSIFPTQDPAVILYLVIVNPKGESHFGGRIAAPVIRECIEFLTSYLDIPKDDENILEHSGRVVISNPQLPEFDDVLPDFSGLPKRSLLPLFERDNLNVVINGNGWVVHQTPPPGTPIDDNMTLVLDLK